MSFPNIHSLPTPLETSESLSMNLLKAPHPAANPKSIAKLKRSQLIKVTAQCITVVLHLLITPDKQRRYHHLIRDTSRRTLSLARSNREAVAAERKHCLKQIESAEEYIGLLRQTCALLDAEMTEADDEITAVRGMLNKRAIAECSLSDNEDGDFIPFSPPSSDSIKGGSGARSSSSDSIYNIHSGSDDDLSPGGEIEVVGEWTSDKDTEGGIGRVSRHVTVKDAED